MNDPKFTAAWHEAHVIDGWLSQREAELLWRGAIATPPTGRIIEVGAYRGRSTALLAHSGRQVVTIDPLVPGFGEGNDMRVRDRDADALDELVERFDNVHWIRRPGTEIEPPPAIDLLYIDGDHTGDAPLRDALHFWPSLTRGARVAFHDYGLQLHVTAAVSYLEVSARLLRLDVSGSMYLGEVI